MTGRTVTGGTVTGRTVTGGTVTGRTVTGGPVTDRYGEAVINRHRCIPSYEAGKSYT